MMAEDFLHWEGENCFRIIINQPAARQITRRPFALDPLGVNERIGLWADCGLAAHEPATWKAADHQVLQ